MKGTKRTPDMKTLIALVLPGLILGAGCTGKEAVPMEFS